MSAGSKFNKKGGREQLPCFVASILMIRETNRMHLLLIIPGLELPDFF